MLPCKMLDLVVAGLVVLLISSEDILQVVVKSAVNTCSFSALANVKTTYELRTRQRQLKV
jgi:hypothetical protein